MIQWLATGWLFILPFTVKCQISPTGSSGMGQMVTTVKGIESIFANSAGLAETSGWNFITLYRLPLGITELSTIGVGIGIPLEVPLGIGFVNFGNNSFRQQILALSGAYVTEKVRLGLKLLYWRILIPEIPVGQALSFEVGLQIALSDQWLASILVINPNQNRIFIEEPLPSSLNAGISYSLEKYFTISAETSNMVGSPLEFKMGMEYLIREKFPLRIGLNTFTRAVHTGLGIHHQRVKFNYALIIHPGIGLTHQTGVSVHWP